MAKIIDLIRRRGTGGFERLLSPHIGHLYRLAYRFCGKREDAEDLVQELLAKLYPRRREIAELEYLRPWLNRALYHLFVDGTRREARSPSPREGDDPDTLAGGGAGPEQGWERTALQRQILEAMRRLTPDQRALVALHDVEGYTLGELTTMLDTPVGTLKSRLHRARRHLRDALEREPFGAKMRLETETNP